MKIQEMNRMRKNPVRYRLVHILFGIASCGCTFCAQIVDDPGFEATAVPYDTAQYDPLGASWTFSPRSGLVHTSPGDSTPIFEGLIAPEGVQVAFLQFVFQTAGEFSQVITLPSDGLYELSYLVAGR